MELIEKQLINNFLKDYELKEDEYLQDNMLYCTKCKTKRLCVLAEFDFVHTIPCKCQQEEFKQKEDLRKQKEIFNEMQYLKKASLLGKIYKDASFEKLDLNRPKDFLEAVEFCKSYCKNWNQVKEQGQGIYFYGDIGTGKSHLTACIANYLTDNFIPVLYTSFMEISKQLRDSFNKNSENNESVFLNRLNNIDLLIIDDLGTENITPWLDAKIYEVINRRCSNKKPTIFSSNYSILELVEKYGLMKRTADRIGKISVIKIKLTGSSYRLKKEAPLF